MDYPPNQNKYRDMKQEEPPKIQQENPSKVKSTQTGKNFSIKFPVPKFHFQPTFQIRNWKKLKCTSGVNFVNAMDVQKTKEPKSEQVKVFGKKNIYIHPYN